MGNIILAILFDNLKVIYWNTQGLFFFSMLLTGKINKWRNVGKTPNNNKSSFVFVAVPQWSPLLSLKPMTVTFILSTISIEDWHFFLLSKCHVCKSHSLTKKYETYCKWRIVSIQMSIFMLKCSIHIKRNSSAQKWLTETGFCYCNSSTAKHYQSTCQK